MKKKNLPLETRQLISPREAGLIYTAQQPVDELTDPVDDPCGTKCKGGSCNSDKAVAPVEDILVF